MAKSKKAKIDTGAYKYGTLKVRGKDGTIHYSSGNGDAVHRAMLLHVASGGTMKQVIDGNKLDVDAKNTNTGLVRMAVGVALRGAIRGGAAVKIGKLSVSSLKQKVALPKVETKAPVRKAAAKSKSKPKKAKAKSSKPRARKAAAPVEAQPEQVAAA